MNPAEEVARRGKETLSAVQGKGDLTTVRDERARMKLVQPG